MYSHGLLNKLEDWGADIEGSLERFMNNEQLYIKFLKKFPGSSDIGILSGALSEKDYKTAITEAHTLKGVTGNLGLTPLYNEFTKIVNDMRAESYDTVDEQYAKIEEDYTIVCAVISSDNE